MLFFSDSGGQIDCESETQHTPIIKRWISLQFGRTQSESSPEIVG